MGQSRPLLIYFLLFNTVDIKLVYKKMFNINFADDWSRNSVLWYCKKPLCNWATTTSLQTFLFISTFITKLATFIKIRTVSNLLVINANVPIWEQFSVNLESYKRRLLQNILCFVSFNWDQCDQKKSPNVYKSCLKMISLEK